ncbi:amino acid ABC transporter permease [Hoyosella subflava]|uniref:Polar amino acid ABC transporter, inner membrane subunit n=1 Tax=Hoyosella subflava (strain DSM 45089 / JCM 17490 / NBRC 109087 / DQS3-9A1) TaxID=443218 RepID=F6EEQ7_HOYSD|nr:amino acid ABC transporter permease [Hoyosella subflava]AEF40857.1 Polar amino acid ABC transporter, inner membrane subunit [Hoyosella subflava DQS3-9A1]
MKALTTLKPPEHGATVLFDAPGPRARRRTLMFSVIAAVAVLAVIGVAILQLVRSGQFSYAKWGPLIDPTNEYFAHVWARLGDGFLRTLIAAVLAIALSLIIGVAIGVARISAGRITRTPIVAFIELFRGLPVILAIYLVSRLADEFRVGVPLPGDNVLRFDLSVLPGGDLLWVLVIGLTAYNSVIIAEIVRSGVVSLPKGQNEAALALGLTRWQSLRMILLPQAFRVMLPALISQLVVVLKDTSLIAVLGGYIELLKMSRLVIENLANPIQVYVVVAAIFIAVNYALTKFAEYVERTLAARTSG